MTVIMARPRLRPPKAKRGNAPRPCQPCRHCEEMRVIKSRGLCWPCWSQLSVRGQYAPLSKYAPHNATGKAPADFYGRAPLPEAPTDARPGSEAKKEILRERASACRQLFHPNDCPNNMK